MALEAEYSPEARAGYRYDLAIVGMHCGGCVTAVERALLAVPGVSNAAVNLPVATAFVEAETEVAADRLIEAVKAAGYGATIVYDGQGRPAALDTNANAEANADGVTALAPRHWQWRLNVALLLLSLFFYDMVAMMAGWPLRLPPHIQLFLAGAAQVMLGLAFYRSAWSGLRNARATMDLLIAIGSGAAFLLSLWQLTLVGPESGHLYFEAATLILCFVVIGKSLEAQAMAKAGDALSGLLRLRPDMAQRLTEGREETVPVDTLSLDDVIRLRPGDRVAADGVIIAGSSSFDEALLTGESHPVWRGEGDKVIAGARNLDGAVSLRVTARSGEDTLAKVARLIQQAQAGKAPVQRLVDRIAAIFVPIVCALAAITFVGWLGAGAALEQALLVAVSVLVISCPCALGLATPTALVAASMAAARAGILIKSVAALEHAATIKAVLFDKTGTLTHGQLELTELHALEGDNAQLLRWAASLEQHSTHPVAKAVLHAARARNIQPLPVADFRSLAGRGVVGEIAGQHLLAGNEAVMVEHDVTLPADDNAQNAGSASTLVWLAVDGVLKGSLQFRDTVRREAKTAISELQRQGLPVAMASGDRQAAVTAIAGELEIVQNSGSLLPQDKVALLKSLQQEKGPVAMIGDGINDAPALAAADLSIAMGNGVDVAVDTAGVALLRPDPRLVPAFFTLGRFCGRVIRQNLFWAFFYNILAIPLAIFGFLNPTVAAAAMAASSLCVVGNAFRLSRWRVDF